MHFYKFDGAANDFILIDARRAAPQLTRDGIARLCDRRRGIGADGLMTLGNAPEGYDFVMRYYNSDGGEATMCGNGGRCIVAFAHLLGIGEREFRFIGPDGEHRATLMLWDKQRQHGRVSLGMRTVARDSIRRVMEGWYLDTGSPHYVQWVNNLAEYDVVGEGRRIRHRADLWSEGTNVDFIEHGADGKLHVRTYERGVEDETWACGTGVTAAAIVTGIHHLSTRGGDFEVSFNATDTEYADIRLEGCVSLNFEGDVNDII